jgi:hypothetical protein
MGIAQKPLQMAPAPWFVKGKVAAPGRRLLLLLAALLLYSAPGEAASAADAFDTSALARVLDEYVTAEGQVRYAALKRDPGELARFVGQLTAVSPENSPELFPTAAAEMAYWINAYNAFVLHAVVEAYPVGSVRDLKFGFGLLFFKRAKFIAGGKRYSLDDIEHGILRRRFADPRIHFALNCASASCPRLWPEPFQADRLDAQLDQAARTFIARKENVWMRGDVLFLSEIFAWYREDFTHALVRAGIKDPSVADYVTRYLPDPVAAQVRGETPRVEFYSYDWTLNDASALQAD